MLRICHSIKFKLCSHIFSTFFDEKFKFKFKHNIFYVLEKVFISLKIRREIRIISLNFKGGSSNFP